MKTAQLCWLYLISIRTERESTTGTFSKAPRFFYVIDNFFITVNNGDFNVCGLFLNKDQDMHVLLLKYCIFLQYMCVQLAYYVNF